MIGEFAMPNLNEFKELYDAALDFKKLKPWKWIYNSDIFGVLNPHTNIVGYCSVMGRLGENKGLAVYLGTEGLESIMKIFMGKIEPDDPEGMIMQKCLMVTFGNEDDLNPLDSAVIWDLNMSFKGRSPYPIFRSFVPGFFPWNINTEECRFLNIALRQVIDVAKRCKDNIKLIRPDISGKFFVRVPKKNNQSLEWEDAYLSPDSYEEEFYTFVLTDEVRLMRLKNSKFKRCDSWEIDTFYAPSPIENTFYRPYYPKVLICFNHETAEPITYHFIKNIQESGYEFVDAFLSAIEDKKTIPRTLYVLKDETHVLFSDIAEKLGIEVIMSDKLNIIRKARYYMLDYIQKNI